MMAHQKKWKKTSNIILTNLAFLRVNPSPAASLSMSGSAALSIQYETSSCTATTVGTTPSKIDDCTSPKQFARQAHRTASLEACFNWWPAGKLLPTIAVGMPHPICRGCANWATDIEDITLPSHSVASTTKSKSAGCGNHWPSSK